MGASCVSDLQKDQHDIAKINMDASKAGGKEELLPTSPISLLFEAMSEEIGYESSALQHYCDQLRSLWIYRVTDLIAIDEETWQQLQIPSVLEHVIIDFLEELKNTQPFLAYQQRSHTDIYVTFVNKDMRTLFKQLLNSVDNFEVAQQHIAYLTKELRARYLLHVDKLKTYMSRAEWDALQVPLNLKKIICRRINLSFYDNNSGEKAAAAAAVHMQPYGLQGPKPGKSDEEKCADDDHDNDEGAAAFGRHKIEVKDDDDDDEEEEIEDGVDVAYANETPLDTSAKSTILQSVSRRFSRFNMNRSAAAVRATATADSDEDEKLFVTDSNEDKLDNTNTNTNTNANSSFADPNLYRFDEKLSKDISVRVVLSELAAWFGKQLLVDDVEDIESHLQWFAHYGYATLYHLSFISDALYEQLLAITDTPKCLRCELYELLKLARHKYSAAMRDTKHILPFASNIYWEKSTVDALQMLQDDVQLNLQAECDVLMRGFYGNVWDWQFLSEAMVQSLPAFGRFEIVRIRMQHIMRLCQQQYFGGRQNIPLLPPVWNSQFNKDLLMHTILPQSEQDKAVSNKYGRNSLLRSFRFEGLDWCHATHCKITALTQYLDVNYVRKLQFLPIQHRKNGPAWTELCTQQDICIHLRFKLNFFAVHGLPSSDDEWLNAYIRDRYRSVLPQFPQSMDHAIVVQKMKIIYVDIEDKVQRIENMLQSINRFNDVDFEGDEHEHQRNKSQLIEMNDMIQATIQEIDDMGLNEQLFEICQQCSAQKLSLLKTQQLKMLFTNDDEEEDVVMAMANITRMQNDGDKTKELRDMNVILQTMKNQIYSIPIDDIVSLSETVCSSVQWLTAELSRFHTNN